MMMNLGMMILGLTAPGFAGRAAAAAPRQRFALAVKNIGAEELICRAALAHWYSVDLGRIAKGQILSTALWADATDGSVYIRTKEGSEIPVLQIWCGTLAHDATTGFYLKLGRHAGQAATPISLACQSTPRAVVCEDVVQQPPKPGLRP